jgi:hypothetical protein
MIKRTFLATAVLTVLLVPGVARASSGEALVWEETRQEIPNGGEISLWQQFNLQGGMVPQCQAEVPATLVTNGQPSDSVSGPASPQWSECGSSVVLGGFTTLEFNPQAITATASPGISITEGNGCTYAISKIEGSSSGPGSEGEAVWEISGTAGLRSGTPCATERHVEGVIELFPRAAGSPLPWRSLEAIEKEKGEREAKEKAAKEATEAKEKAAREEKERHETEAAVTSVANVLFPSGASAHIKKLLKANGWSFAFAAPWPGELVIEWYEVPKESHSSKTVHPVLVAAGRASFTTVNHGNVRVRLTAKGKRLLKKAKKLTVTAKGTFLSFSRPALRAQKTFTLRRQRQ